MYQIGFIIAENSLPHLSNIQALLEQKCKPTFLTYRSLAEIPNLYTKNASSLHGIILGGELAHIVLQQNPDQANVIPTRYLDVTELDFYKLLFQIQVNHPALTTSRLSIDGLSEDNDYMKLSEILSPERLPFYPEKAVDRLSYDAILQFHIQLWEQGKIDGCITRYSNIMNELAKHNIQAFHLFPSEKTLMDTLQDLLMDIKTKEIEANQTAIGVIQLSGFLAKEEQHEVEVELALAVLHKEVLSIASKAQLPVMVQKHKRYIQLMVPQQHLVQYWTNQLTNCKLLPMLSIKVATRIDIGWGAGETIFQSQLLAEQAVSLARQQPLASTFVGLSDERYIGPLDGSQTLEVHNKLDPNIVRWSELTKLSTLQLQKISSVMHKLKSNELSSQQVALHLGITIRSANRIMNALEQGGAAVASFKKQAKLKGRPTKVYFVDFKIN